MSKLWKNSGKRPHAPWLILAALLGCADPTSENEPDDEQRALPLDPPVEEGSAGAADDVGPATRDGTGREDPTRDLEGLVLGGYQDWTAWLGSYSGTLYFEEPGSGAVIDAVQVRSGNYVDAIRFHYYFPSEPDNLYHGEGAYWTSWYGPTNRGTLREAFWCQEATGLVGYSGFTDAGRIVGLAFRCNNVSEELGPWGPLDFSPYWGGNGGPPIVYDRPCAEDQVVTSFSIRADSASLRGIGSLCRSKW
jgi:hypothetical protein